jgi:hypothetical protein
VETGFAPNDAEADITLAIRDRKIRWTASEKKITITTFEGVIVHPLNHAVLSLKRRAEWRLSLPEDLSPGDLDFENSSSKKPWRYPGFHAHISSGLLLRFNDFLRVFGLDDVIAVEAAVQPPQPSDQKATTGQNYLAPNWENSRPKEPWSYGEGYLAHIVPLDLSEEDAENVVRRGAADSPKEPLAQSPRLSTKKASALEIKRAVEVLAAAFRINPKLLRKNAEQLIKDAKLPLGPTQFDNAWHTARLQAGLPVNARGGRPPKSSHPTVK